jgi:ABC-2 type transport system ATP-binding protein
MHAAIEAKNLVKRYGQTTALHGLSFTVGKGEVFAFLGPNGAGKTTTIKILAGLLRPNEGEAFIDGVNVVTDSVRAKTLISYVPDEPYLYEKLTAREFLRFIGDVYRIPEKIVKERISALTEEFELGAFLDDLTESFSHGMKQRTVLAAALLHDPRVLIVDEPLVGLDPKSARRLKDSFRRLAQERDTTVFMSTHTLSVAEEVADRIGILHRGRLIAVGTLDEIHRLSRSVAPSESQARGLEDLFLELTAD